MADISNRLSGSRTIFCAWICSGQRLTFKANLSIFWSSFLTKNVKINHLISSIALNINRRLCVICKFQIFISTCNCRICRRIHIIYNHGVIKTLCHLKLCTDYCIVQSCGHLTNPTTVSLYCSSIFKRTCQLIAILCIKRADCLIDRKTVSRINNRTVDLRSPVLHILGTTCARTAIGSMK